MNCRSCFEDGSTHTVERVFVSESFSVVSNGEEDVHGAPSVRQTAIPTTLNVHYICQRSTVPISMCIVLQWCVFFLLLYQWSKFVKCHGCSWFVFLI